MPADSRPQSCNYAPVPLEIDEEEDSETTMTEAECSYSFCCIICRHTWEGEGPHQTWCV
ncbi:hypothetical protein Pint_35222 [Pistacia integerrima]|uniref:Uncharacterized protein n=1 Tax=Pistacia integerrima TaxID=434235 RepID=A0ACC0Y691_9ROSI|nr:hypothetical protein Pint_35222 [Pistacia integerrima]